MQRQIIQYVLLDAVSATTHSSVKLVSDFQHKDVVISTSGLGTGDSITVKVKVAFTDAAPDFTAAQSSANEWTYVQLINLEDGSPEDGDLGVTISEVDGVLAYSVNADGVRWLVAELSAITDPTTSATVRLSQYN